MKLNIQTLTEATSIELDPLAEQYSGVINIGQKCKNVWNTIALDDPSVDPFQCQLIGTAGSYRLQHGQNRTECPKGLISSKLIPCNGCTGRCVNIHAGRPKYYQRNPEIVTMVNDKPIGQFGANLKEGNQIKIGSVVITVE